MRTRSPASLLSMAALILAATASAAVPAAGQSQSSGEHALWKIGAKDGASAEFALAPGGYASYRDDGFFVVGRSDPKRDWPYVQPGPDDGWAGRRRHTFTVVFGVKARPSGSGTCTLEIALVDSQSRTPPELKIELNGHERRHRLAPGGGDASIVGRVDQAKHARVQISFPVETLRQGPNVLTISTLSGSWLLYDGLEFRTPAEVEPARAEGTLISGLEVLPGLRTRQGKLYQSARLTVLHLGDETRGRLKLGTEPPTDLPLARGARTAEVELPDADKDMALPVAIEAGGKTLAARTFTLKPQRKLTVYILPHSHTDIGYTEIQTRIEQKQVDNLLQGIAAARQTASYPEGARFVWNVEVLWAAELYLNRLGPAQRALFLDAVKKGQVALNGMYLNELTGLCRPEELLRLFRYSTRLSEQCGVPIDSAMISDVPGYTWGTVTAMAHAGIKYFSTAPNFFDRIGDILVKWENRPFYWVSPSGKEKVLVWIPSKGYAMSHIVRELTPRFVADYLAELERTGYPYDIAHIRWSGHGDNATPDPAICEFVKQWNTEHVWPKFIIASTSEAFRAFEARYGDKLPRVRGDWTPYWEDGAGSSALETGLNRGSADRLSQAETLWAMVDPPSYPAGLFEEAWRNVLLYSEHTWGAYCSITEPAAPLTQDQWQIKQSFAAQGNLQSRALLVQSLAKREGVGDPMVASADIDVYNTASWPRTDLVSVPKGISEHGDRVADDQGRAVPSQRLGSGDLVFLAADMPPLSGRRYTLSPGSPHAIAGAAVKGLVLDNGLVQVKIDPRTGGLGELMGRGIEANLVDSSSGHAINDYLYLKGDDLAGLQGTGPVTIKPGDHGPLVASLVIDSEAPGCHHLRREVRLTAGLDRVELINTVDKQRLAARSYQDKDGKESVNFAFPFHVPDGQMLLDLPIGAMRPNLDQMPSACKNWLTVGRWVDVSNRDFGVTWVTLDAPLVQLGGLTARLLNSQTNPDTWRKTIEPTQQLYSWAMNNHWGTNYRAYQEGPTVFRFVLRAHRQADPAEASRFAIGLSQPLVATPARGPKPPATPLFQLSNNDVLVTALKPSDDGKAWIVRLYGASGKERQVRLSWASPGPGKTWMSDTSERPIAETHDPVTVPGWGIVSLRVELAK
jgi:alpha-mannosidase